MHLPCPAEQGFDTTQGKQSDDPRTSVGAVKVKSTRQARQFMNRRVGDRDCGSCLPVQAVRGGV